MRVVDPAPKKRNITFRYDVGAAIAAAAAAASLIGRQKRLQRLPHIFSKVLELPFGADANVAMEEDAGGFRFVAATDDLWDDVRARAVELYPGVMKVVIRDSGGGVEDDVGHEEERELDRWRFRLPPCTVPALATAAYADGSLVVTVPKGAEAEEDIVGGDEGEEEEFFMGDDDGEFRGHLVTAQ